MDKGFRGTEGTESSADIIVEEYGKEATEKIQYIMKKDDE